MSTEVTLESLRTHAEWLDDPRSEHFMENRAIADGLRLVVDRLEREQRPLPEVPGWYPTIVVERGGESCTGAGTATTGAGGGMSTVGYVPSRGYEQRLRTALAEAYTAEGVEVVMRSKLTLPGAPPWSWTWREYVAHGMGDVVLDWAESLTGMVAT